MTYPTIRPELTLDFANSRQLDPRITFSRTSGATYLNPDTGLITLASEHEARFEKEGLLIEESRTNTTQQSKPNNTWYPEGVTIQNSSEINPLGNATSARILANSGYQNQGIRTYDSQGVINGTSVVSAFVKADTHRYVVIGYGGQTNSYTAAFDIDPSVTGDRLLGQGGDGTHSNIDAGYQNYPNGWVRIWASGTTSGSDGFDIGLSPDANTYNFVDWTAAGTEAIFVYGAQTERAVSFPTSFIPTSGSTVTRSADIAQITGDNFSSWYQPLENTMFAKFSTFDTGTNSKAALVTFDSTQGPSINTTVNGGRAFYYVGDTNYIQVTTRTPQKVRRFFPYDPGYNPLGQFNSIAQGYAGTDSGCAVNGSDPGYTNSASLNPGTVDSMWIGRNENVSMWLNGHISRLAYYSRRLTDSELQTITL